MRSSRIFPHHGTAATAAVSTARAKPAQAAAAIAGESGHSPQMSHETAADIPAVFADAAYERRSGVDRRSLARREERQKVWLDTRSGQDRRRQNRRASDQLSVVSLKI